MRGKATCPSGPIPWARSRKNGIRNRETTGTRRQARTRGTRSRAARPAQPSKMGAPMVVVRRLADQAPAYPVLVGVTALAVHEDDLVALHHGLILQGAQRDEDAGPGLPLKQ
jgi:hypothetical protein